MYAIKTLWDQPFRFVFTTVGIALCAVLVLFLLSIYRGVAVGSVEYVRSSDADLWVLQRHATNILRSTSLLKSRHGVIMRETEGVESVEPVFFVLATVQLPEGPATLYLAGYDPESGQGGPPAIVAGRNIASDREIVLDRSFAAKYKIGIGDTLMIRKDTLSVVGLSKGTNMFVLQYAFISLTEAHRIVGMGGIVSCYLVKVKSGSRPATIAARIEQQLPDVAVFDRETFLENNMREMEAGVLPVFFVMALIGSVVLTAILSLILTINVLERRKDFAVMKALGAPKGFVPRLVLVQALVLSASGLVLGMLAFYPLMQLVERLAPEVSVIMDTFQLVAVSAGVLVISLISAIYPIQKLSKIYPLEVFK